MSSIKVLIADDHQLFREGLGQICRLKGGFEIVGYAENGQEAVELVQRLEPDVTLMDLGMPVMNGVEAIERIMQAQPTARIIVLTMYREDDYLFKAIKAGARGYLLKNVSSQTVIEAIEAAHRGEALIDPITATKLLDEFRRLSEEAGEETQREQLTKGEMDVLLLVAEGADNQTIAEQLNLSARTVANRLRSTYQKLQVNNRTQAALYALRRGWATLDGSRQ
ncbi:MAG: response regulator [Ardenticatenaceae bacterium]